MHILCFDECAFVILFIFFLSFIVRKQYRGRTNFIMFILLIFIMIATFADLTSGVMDNYAPPTRGYRIVSYVANYIYFAVHTLTLPTYILYFYSSVDIWHVFKAKKYLKYFMTITVAITTIGIVGNGFLTNLFYIDETVHYVRGSYVIVLYAVAAVQAFWIAKSLFHYRKLVNKDKFRALVFLFVVVAAGMLVQLIFPTVLMESFAIALAFLFFMVIVRREENQIDPITGATKYNEGIERVLKNFESHKPVSVILLKFANHNNLYLYLGHEEYNKMLHIITDKLKQIAEDHDYVSEVFYLEYGLFAYLGENLDDEVLTQVSEECKKVFVVQLQVGSFQVMPNVRISVVKCPEEIADFSTLFTFGTTYHYTLPQNNEIHWYRDYRDNKDFKIRNEMDDILKRAIENKGFEMYYQPIYSTVEKRFVSAEALIRLHDRYHGAISPGMFIPVAEITGAMHAIGNFVLEDVIRFISQNDIHKLGLKYIEMNLSASQCIEVDLVDKIKNLLDEYHVEPECISLEITENSANINPEIVDANVQKLHEYGIRFALDDYGTGYSNIKRVTALPIDQVKLDKSFVDMIDDPQMWIVIQDTIKMLKEMGKEVLVEGIEEASVAQRFMDINTDLFQGCELIQGFYFCKPLPKDEFIEFMKEHI